MQIVRKDVGILTDNEENFLSMLEGIINSVDELSTVQMSNNLDSFQFRIAPSIPRYGIPLLEEILTFHNLMGIRLDLSKSIKSSGVLIFSIKL